MFPPVQAHDVSAWYNHPDMKMNNIFVPHYWNHK